MYVSYIIDYKYNFIGFNLDIVLKSWLKEYVLGEFGLSPLISLILSASTHLSKMPGLNLNALSSLSASSRLNVGFVTPISAKAFQTPAVTPASNPFS